MQHTDSSKSFFHTLGFGALCLASAFLIINLLMPNTRGANTTLNLVISGGAITIGSTGAFSRGTFTVSSTNQTTEKQFTGAGEPFFVEDLKGAYSGYYTTISTTQLTGPNNATIPANNIRIKTDTLTAVLITGTANTKVVLPAGFLTYQTFSTPITFIKRDPAANSGVIGKYGVWPFLELTIPAYQSVGSYSGSVTYTLIEN